jgi:hypothetical protein
MILLALTICETDERNKTTIVLQKQDSTSRVAWTTHWGVLRMLLEGHDDHAALKDSSLAIAKLTVSRPEGCVREVIATGVPILVVPKVARGARVAAMPPPEEEDDLLVSLRCGFQSCVGAAKKRKKIEVAEGAPKLVPPGGAGKPKKMLVKVAGAEDAESDRTSSSASSAKSDATDAKALVAWLDGAKGKGKGKGKGKDPADEAAPKRILLDDDELLIVLAAPKAAPPAPPIPGPGLAGSSGDLLMPMPIPPLPLADLPAPPEHAFMPGEWVKMEIPFLGTIVHEKVHKRLNAHCIHPPHLVDAGRKQKCHLDCLLYANPRKGMEGQGRPVGYLVAWLEDAAVSGDVKDEHQTYKKSLRSVAGKDRRVRARLFAKEHATLKYLLLLERDKREGEESEPDDL